MKLNIFTKSKSTDEHQLLQQQIEQEVSNFKKNPGSWDESKLGDQEAIGQQIRHRLLNSMAKQQRLRPNYRKIASIAASVVLVTTIAWFSLNYKNYLKKTPEEIQLLTMITGKNQIKKFTLSDGTTVWLNASSRLRYPKTFGVKKREVVLIEGEAYFDVYHDSRKPFQVKAGKTLTNVLGTSFNISSYPWKSTINVTVASGKVAVNNQILLPNDQLSFHKASNHFEKKRLQRNYTPLWINREIVFDDDDMKTIAAVLENRFNVTVSFADSDGALERQKFTATFEPQDQLETILNMLALTGNFDYQIKDNKVILKR